MQDPKDIRLKLDRLIQDAQTVAPNLASRLDEMRRWIAQKKFGLLMRKRHVMQLLAELVEDSDFWLVVQSLPEEDRNTEFAKLSSAERYWYKYLFPSWFNEKDPRLSNWKQKLMAELFEGSDASLIEESCLEVEACSGATCNPYIADLSMATDLIASGTKGIALCVQLTSVRESLAVDKRNEWKSTLEYWGIRRGVFVRFNPRRNQVCSVIDKYGFSSSDQLPEQCYLEHSINSRD